MTHLHHNTLLYSPNTVTCSLTLSLCTKRLWRMSWQHTSIWSWERWNSLWNTSWLRTRDIMNGERLGNVVVYSSLSIAALVQHLTKATLRVSKQTTIGNWRIIKTLHEWILSTRSDLPKKIEVPIQKKTDDDEMIQPPLKKIFCWCNWDKDSAFVCAADIRVNTKIIWRPFEFEGGVSRCNICSDRRHYLAALLVAAAVQYNIGITSEEESFGVRPSGRNDRKKWDTRSISLCMRSLVRMDSSKLRCGGVIIWISLLWDIIYTHSCFVSRWKIVQQHLHWNCPSRLHLYTSYQCTISLLLPAPVSRSK